MFGEIQTDMAWETVSERLLARSKRETACHFLDSDICSFAELAFVRVRGKVFRTKLAGRDTCNRDRTFDDGKDDLSNSTVDALLDCKSECRVRVKWIKLMVNHNRLDQRIQYLFDVCTHATVCLWCTRRTKRYNLPFTAYLRSTHICSHGKSVNIMHYTRQSWAAQRLHRRATPQNIRHLDRL